MKHNLDINVCLCIDFAFTCFSMQALRVMFVAERISYRAIFEDWKHAVDDFLSSPDALSCNSVRSSAFSSLQPLFLPVVGLGKDADLNDLISLDLLAAC